MHEKPTYEDLENRVRELEAENDRLSATGDAARADMAAAVEKLKNEAEERDKAEETLQDSEARYRSLFQNNHAVMLLIDPATAEIVDANPAASTYYGWGPDEIKSKKIYEINILPKEQVFDEMERARLEQRRCFHFNHRLANGDIRDVEVYSGLITLGYRKLLYSIVHDVTERRTAENALRAESLRRAILMDASLDGIAIHNQAHKVVDANRRFAEMLGYPVEEVLGLYTWDFEANMTEAQIRSGFSDLSRTNRIFQTRHR